ncbi:MAG: hypothetical protein F6J93_29790 [Oscillatoria sp. SIO1A7]|nr:hypothetical protein [Oscillatoria sp. SIO1A7]
MPGCKDFALGTLFVRDFSSFPLGNNLFSKWYRARAKAPFSCHAWQENGAFASRGNRAKYAGNTILDARMQGFWIEETLSVRSL